MWPIEQLYIELGFKPSRKTFFLYFYQFCHAWVKIGFLNDTALVTIMSRIHVFLISNVYLLSIRISRSSILGIYTNRMENWKQTHCAQICTAYVKLTESAFDAFARPCFCVPKFRLWLSAPLSFFGTFLVPYCKYLKVPESKQKMILVWVLDFFFLMFSPNSIPFCLAPVSDPTPDGCTYKRIHITEMKFWAV